MEALESLRQIQDGTCDSTPASSNLQMILHEMREISQLAPVLKEEGLATIETDTRTHLQEHVTILGYTILNDTNDLKYAFQENFQKGIVIATERLDHGLNELSALHGLDNECNSTLDSARSGVETDCNVLSQNIKSLLESKGKYRKKSDCLHTIEQLGENIHVSSLLPRLDKCKGWARDGVASEAKNIEDCVSQTAEWDKIDKLLLQFQEARIIDKFISNDASSRLGPLMKLRKKKESQVDDLLEELIRNQDFRGIKEFLEPFASSKDQMKQQKFEKWSNKIDSSL
eukprot:13325010-Ditylum_brightwellii.AAC.1